VGAKNLVLSQAQKRIIGCGSKEFGSTSKRIIGCGSKEFGSTAGSKTYYWMVYGNTNKIKQQEHVLN